MLLIDPLSLVNCELGSVWIAIVSHKWDQVPSDWYLRNLETKSSFPGEQEHASHCQLILILQSSMWQTVKSRRKFPSETTSFDLLILVLLLVLFDLGQTEKCAS